MTAPTPSRPAALVRSVGLPSGRAVVGGLLITVAALGSLWLTTADAATPPDYLVTTVAIDAGTVLTADHLESLPVDLPASLSINAFTQPGDLLGAVALAPLRAGELVQSSSVLIGEADEAATSVGEEFSFRLERSRAVDGSLNRGERIHLLATYGSGAEAETWIIVRHALLTRVDNADAGGIGRGDEVTLTISVASLTDVLALTHALDVASVTVVRATRSDDGTPLEGGDVYLGPEGATP